MKKYFRVKGLDCAHCASKLERSIAKVKGVESVAIDFLGQKIMIISSGNDYDKTIESIIKVAQNTIDGIVIEEL